MYVSKHMLDSSFEDAINDTLISYSSSDDRVTMSSIGLVKSTELINNFPPGATDIAITITAVDISQSLADFKDVLQITGYEWINTATCTIHVTNN
jgi:hypothetical protein